jgi:hypothetical protein
MAENKQQIKLPTPNAIEIRDHFISLAFVECVRDDLEHKRFQHATVGDYAVRYADGVMRSREKSVGKVTVVAVGKPEGAAPEEPAEMVAPVEPPPAPVAPPAEAAPIPPPGRNPSIKDHMPALPPVAEVV